MSFIKYVPGVEVLYMNLHSPHLDKILHKYLSDEDITTLKDDEIIYGDVDGVGRSESRLDFMNTTTTRSNGVETSV